MVVLPDDTERIQSYLDENPNAQLNLVIVYILVYPTDNGKGTKMNNNQPTPQQEATPNAEEDEFMPCPNMPIEQQQEEMATKLTVPPNAQQVEKVVLDTSSDDLRPRSSLLS